MVHIEKNKKFRIIYIFPQEIGKGPNAIYTYFLRISNFLNSKRERLPVKIDEIYIDLRFEELPSFNFQNLDLYLKSLKNLMNKVYNDFPFELVAISCYSSYEYLNSIIVANLIKTWINPKAKIVVGGYHPSIFPEEFQSNKIPAFIHEQFPICSNLFDFLIKGEGEIAFFKLVMQLLNNRLKNENNEYATFEILDGETFVSLNDLPLIDLSLLKRYREKLKGKRLNIDFGRGCMFQCKICIPSTGMDLAFHKHVRFKSVDKCIEELEIIKDTKWLEINAIAISDPIFFPKRKLRTEFYEKFRNFIKIKGKYPYTIAIYDRVDLGSKEDLLNYKEFNIIPQLGFESASIPMLKILNKINSKNEEAIKKYISNLEDLIIFANKIDLNIQMNVIIGLPGETEETIRENRAFFLEKRFNGMCLSEKYRIIVDIRYYKALPGSIIYNECEKKYGGKIYYKKWWRTPLENHRVYNKIVKPSKNLEFIDSLKLNYAWVKEFLGHQINNGTPFYDKGDFKILREGYFKFAHMHKKIDANYYSFIPEFWKKGFIYP
ncbi:MAG: B12-binding domain-containing radical SAM protein [Candidatus Thorarchaeota archaeon]